jgi:hypothetical protein
MVLGITAYFILSMIISISAIFNGGWSAGVSAFLTSVFAFIAGSRLKSLVFWEDWKGANAQNMAIAGVVVSVILIGVAYWLSNYFSVQLFGVFLSGTIWGAIGLVVCFLCTDKKMAGKLPFESS